MHMVRSHHKEVMLHRDSPLGDTVPECFHCGSKNAFVLGFIPAKGDSVVMLLCRYPCANMRSVNGVTWDAEQWLPLVQERSFPPWLVNVPQPEELKLARPVSTGDIQMLEEMWSRDEHAKLGLPSKPELEQHVKPTRLTYDNAKDYATTFQPLVEIEADNDRRMKAMQTQRDVSIRWELRPNRQYLAWLRLPQLESGENRLAMGDEVLLSHDTVTTHKWSERGIVVFLPKTAAMELAIAVAADENIINMTTGFTIEFMWKGATFDRMQEALRHIAQPKPNINKYILSKIFGHKVQPLTLKNTVPKRVSVPGLAQLNPSQEAAVKAVLQQPLSMIQGPPGTGKTVTSATIIYQLSRIAKAGRGKVLVCAPSNVAVNELTERVHATKLKVVRVMARARETLDSSVRALSLQELALQHAKDPELRRLADTKRELGQLSAQDERKYRKQMRRMENDLLNSADVICTTCAGAGDVRLRKLRVSVVLIDEATQANEPESLIPLIHGCQQLVIVGDHKQLGPITVDPVTKRAGFQSSLFERLVKLGNTPHRLEVQYRMHPCLVDFPSNTFYEGALQNGVTEAQRTRASVKFPWPRPDMPMLFYQNLGPEEISGSGTSYLNRTEAAMVESVITAFLQSDVQPSHIGVVTPYEGQRTYLMNHMQMYGTLNKSLYESIEVASVDAFQGREKDYVIFSCVRSNDRQELGFLRDPRRMNVALTRAKYGLVIIGNPKLLNRDYVWHKLLQHSKERGVLVEGPLSKLRPTVLRFAEPTDRTARWHVTSGMESVPGTQYGSTNDSGARDSAGNAHVNGL